MSCAFSREVLALYIEGDLSDHSALEVRAHLAKCGECERFCEQLENSQSLLKSLRSTAATPTALKEVRREVMSQIDYVEETLGWAVRLERFLLLGFRRWRYAAAGVAALVILAVVTSTVDGHKPLHATETVVFDGKDRLLRPDGYREWVPVGSSDPAKTVYINPDAYRIFSKTGQFPEGTVMVLEANAVLQVSVKDTRFGGGWGYFGFSGPDKAKAPLDEGNCRTCHEARAETDQVFTQFYPALKLRRG